MENHGVLLGQRDSDYIGGTLPYEIVNPSGDWTAYLPDPEWQTTTKIDTMACVSFSALNCLETLIYFHTGQKKNFSDRFLAYMSGTTIHGNFLFKVADSIRKDGLILQEEWKTESDMDWATYYAVPPIELINKAKNFLDEWTVNYEFIDFTKESLIKHLKQSPIQVVIPGHAVMLFTTTEQVYKYFDHYSPFQKDRAEPFISALKYVITRKNNMEYVIVGKTQYLIHEPLKLAIGIGDEQELVKLQLRGLIGQPIVKESIDKYLVYPGVDVNRLRDILNV